VIRVATSLAPVDAVRDKFRMGDPGGNRFGFSRQHTRAHKAPAETGPFSTVILDSHKAPALQTPATSIPGSRSIRPERPSCYSTASPQNGHCKPATAT